MKKLITLLAMLAIAGIASADLVDGTFDNLSADFGSAAAAGDAAPDAVNNMNDGWHQNWSADDGGGYAVLPSGAITEADVSMAQIFDNTGISGYGANAAIEFDYRLDVTGAPELDTSGLQVVVYGMQNNTKAYGTTINIGTTLSSGNANAIELLRYSIDIDADTGGWVTDAQTGTFDASAYSWYGVALVGENLTARAGAGNVELLGFDNVSIVAVPEPATVGMLGLGALVALLIRRVRA